MLNINRNSIFYRIRKWSRDLTSADIKNGFHITVDAIGTILALILIFASLLFLPHFFF